MAKAGKSSNYDLNRPFLDDSKNIYSKDTLKSLRFWCRMTPNSPTDLGPNSLSPAYDSSPTISSIILGNKTYYAMVANDAAGQAARISTASGFLSFSSVGSGELPTATSDRPFSVSLWVKLDNLAALQLLFSKDSGTGAYNVDYEYKVNVNASGNIEFFLNDKNATATQKITYTSISAGIWYHLVFTYDGRGTNSAYQGMKIYVNGSSVSTSQTVAGTYVGMNPSYAYPLLIAQDADELDELDGQMAEFAVWGKELTASEVLAIYNVTREGAHFASSGIISNPARILLQERDNKTGSYPTIARTGDPDFSGNYSVYYDDTNTINFVGNNNTVYPTALPNVNKWVSGGIATPNILQGLITAGTASKGVADAQVSFTPGQDISPFNESRIYIDSDSTFYQTGTDPNILPRFNERLSSKISLSFDFFNVSHHEVYFSTGTSDISRRSGVSYFNFEGSRWLAAGDTTSANSVDFLGGNFQKGYVGFSAKSAVNFTNADEQDNAGIGYPISNFGFPYDSRFEPTDSELFSMTGSLSAPFLLEKIVLEFSASFPASSFDTSDAPLTTQFFLLRQGKSGNVSGFIPQQQAIARSSGNTTYSTTLITQSLDRDLISYGIISRFSTVSNSNASLRLRDLNMISAGAINAITSSFRLEFPCRGIPLNGGSTLIFDRSSSATTAKPNYLVDNSVGTRSGKLSSGRSFIKTVGGTVLSGSILQLSSSNSQAGYHIPRVESYDVTSPYLLLPNDKICLGFSNIAFFPFDALGSGDVVGEDGLSKYRMGLPAQPFKLTMFGSLLQNNLPVDSETNQPLTSDSIHEDLHYDNPVFDQFDVEPTSALTGSYIDLIITGSMLATPIGDPTAANVRKVQGSVVAGQAGTTGSLQRFVSLISTTDRYYDTLLPNPLEITLKNGFTTWNAGPNYTLEEGVVGDGYNDRADEKWLRSFPFSPEYLSFSRQATFSKPQIGDYGSVNPVRGVAELTFDGGGVFTRKVEFSPRISYTGQEIASNVSIYRQFYGIGDGLADRPTLINLVDTGLGFMSNKIYAGNLVLRGFKYGVLNAESQNTKVIFRRDHYGQYRDILEQSPNAAFFVKNVVEYPVEIQFYSRPSKDGKGRLPLIDPAQTHSQNLSSFATSSLPYFDGVARERTDNPDLILEDVSII